ncbi:MAG: hypothetical protein ILP23_03285 [Paludibacteraceae bacterium]|nr:hypothetical protein [Paludibacteraceae bacterium]
MNTKRILSLLCLAAVMMLTACGPKHDAKKIVKKKQMFYTTANKAAEDGVLTDDEVDELLFIYHSIENINDKYKKADKETQRKYKEELSHIESIDTKTNYIGAMMLIAFCEGADKFSLKEKK